MRAPVVCSLLALLPRLLAQSFSPSEELQRPQCHFLPASNWMNDPNAPFYDSNTELFHLFYQYLTPRTWGHAVSYNLVDWEILPMALNYSDSYFTDQPNSTAGVYSGSALMMNMASGKTVPWLSVSVPTNDMQLLAYPSDLTDPYYTEWTYLEDNPVILSDESNSVPPGRDPTEAWQCGEADENKWCLTYATQASEGCPCSGISGSVVFSSVFDSDDGDVGTWSAWSEEGYLLNDTEKGALEAVMWECTDLFPLLPDENIWLFKYSIGPGPSYTNPWGNPGPRDYYVTGVYKPFETETVSASEVSTTQFLPFSEQYSAAMQRDETTSLDPGAFYASKSFLYPDVGRVLFGWLPEERPVDGHGEPYGWAGAMSLPRLVVPYQIPGDSAYYIRTPVLESAINALHQSEEVYSRQDVSGLPPSMINLAQTAGDQLDIFTSVSVRGMDSEDSCGIRLRSTITDIDHVTSTDEFTDVYIQFTNCGIPLGQTESVCQTMTLNVDTTYSNSNMSIPVNRSSCQSGPVDYNALLLDDHNEESVYLRAILDHSVVEGFLGSGGERAVTRRVYPSAVQDAINVQLFSRCGDGGSSCKCQFLSTNSWTLRSSTSDITSSSSNSDSNNTVYYVVLPIVLVALLAFFAYRVFYQRKSESEPLLEGK